MGKNLNGRNFRIHWTHNWKVVTLDRPKDFFWNMDVEHPISLLRVKEYRFGRKAAENLSMQSAYTP